MDENNILKVKSINQIPENFTGIVEYSNGTKHWYLNGKHHRLEGPAVEYFSGRKQWWIDGIKYSKEIFDRKMKKMNLGKEATLKIRNLLEIPENYTGFVENHSGNKFIFSNGKLHHVTKPALEYHDGTKYWCFNGKLHNINGPAIEYPDGKKEYYLCGDLLTEEQYKKSVESINKSSDFLITTAKNHSDKIKNDYTGMFLDRDCKHHFVNGIFHKENEPAYEHSDGSKSWFLCGVRHRKDGLATDLTTGRKEYFLFGTRYKEEEYHKTLKELSNIDHIDVVDLSEISDNFTGKVHFIKTDNNQYFIAGRNVSLEDYENYVKTKSLINENILFSKDEEECPENYTGIIQYESGSKIWFKNGEYHRENGPAIEESDGRKEWWINGIPHRLNGPAIEDKNGIKSWYVNGKHHKLDGPAVEGNYGIKEWWIDGVEYSEEEFNKKIGKPISQNDKKEEKQENVLKATNFDEVPKDYSGIVQYDEARVWYKHGRIHRLNGPAWENPNGAKLYYIDGKEYLMDEFFLKIKDTVFYFDTFDDIPKDFIGMAKDSNEDQRWYSNGKLHREDGPAIEFKNGTKCWFKRGEYHRLNGPALDRSNGDKEWWFNGKLHRLDGPAAEYSNGIKCWYIENVRYTEEEYNKKIEEIKLENEKLEEQINLKVRNFSDIPNSFTGIAKTDKGNKYWYKNGLFHRLDGPAVEYVNGEKSWYIYNVEYSKERFDRKIQEMNQYKILKIESFEYIPNDYTGIGQYENGNKCWFKNGLYHREDGPAIEWKCGHKSWYINGKEHRLDGPAIEYSDGTNAWFIEGKRYSKEDFNNKIKEMNKFSLKNDVRLIAKRVGVRKAVDMINNFFVNFLTKNGSTIDIKRKKELLVNLLKSENGKALTSFLFGIGMPMLKTQLSEKNSDFIEEISQELRVDGMAHFSSTLIDWISDPLFLVAKNELTNALEKVINTDAPDDSQNIRINVSENISNDHEEIQEELVEESKLKEQSL